MLISQDQSIAAAYSPKKVTLTKDMIGTRYVFLAIRTFMDPNDEADVQAAHKLQDQVVVNQDADKRIRRFLISRNTKEADKC